ncbi:methylated-DNA--[protein]-cysteine S-methyltransferase [Rhodobacter sp. CZR27]|uniref:methylated-DNA--[protein]-cysteine S-methyltransferase n=1 Tax=Rhodobacter sp. CZR27 TaxID=2033869 RepID=UPI000BBEEBC5|nr:methylated-DNA--[protein]-cysteine S-methyltransferase [Rhodobacter sp. CZR27]
MKASFLSPLGRLVLTEEDGRLTRLAWSDEPGGETSPLLDEAIAQVQAYFDRRLTVFDLPLELGEGRQALFLKALRRIPFGETRRYDELAKALGISAQAVGQACGRNPLPILVPCHRVLAATGLGGFSAPGGIETKVALLRHEGALLL